jgi:hypothetical protein
MVEIAVVMLAPSLIFSVVSVLSLSKRLRLTTGAEVTGTGWISGGI